MIGFDLIGNNMVIPMRNCKIFLNNNRSQFDLKQIYQIRRNQKESSQSTLHLYDLFAIYHENPFMIC